jgi:hypothetical protein
VRKLNVLTDGAVPMSAVEAYICPSHALAFGSCTHNVDKIANGTHFSDSQQLPILVITGGKCSVVYGETTWDVICIGDAFNSMNVSK